MIDDRARRSETDRLYDDAIVIDTHNDMPSRLLDEQFDPGVRHSPSASHTDIPRLLEGGISAVWMAAWVDAAYAVGEPGRSFPRAQRYLDAIHNMVETHRTSLCLGTRAADVVRAKREGRVAIYIGVEGGHAIEASLDNLRMLYERGARYLTLTWNNGNEWAGSSLGSNETSMGGLTDFGRQVIREMNRLGMLVDVSHVSDATLADVLATSASPIIASHSSARALADHPRNLTDEQLRAIAGRGGVVCVNFFSRFIDRRFRLAMDEAEREVKALQLPEPERKERMRERIGAIPPTPLSVLLDHIGRVADVAGIEHVGLGSDFDGVPALPDGIDDVTGVRRVAAGLMERGYAWSDVARILGGNVLALMQRVIG
jgi:membrane dipeptidase